MGGAISDTDGMWRTDARTYTRTRRRRRRRRQISPGYRFAGRYDTVYYRLYVSWSTERTEAKKRNDRCIENVCSQRRGGRARLRPAARSDELIRLMCRQ